jgi:hypothetical protein
MGHTVQLGRMVRVQKKLTALYETRLATHKTAAAMAAAEADAIATRAARPGSLTGMHPELCQAAIAKALARHQDHLAEAEIDAERLAVASARVGQLEEAYREALHRDIEQRAERERLELLQNPRRKPPE